MTKVELFAYLAAFVSIVLAVALTDMIHSAHRLFRARQQVKWDPLALLLALNVFILLLWNFFGLWGDAQYDRITFNGLLAMMTVPTLYTFAAFAVLTRRSSGARIGPSKISLRQSPLHCDFASTCSVWRFGSEHPLRCLAWDAELPHVLGNASRRFRLYRHRVLGHLFCTRLAHPTGGRS